MTGTVTLIFIGLTACFSALNCVEICRRRPPPAVILLPAVVCTSLAIAEKRITCEFSSKPVSYGLTLTIITFTSASA